MIKKILWLLMIVLAVIIGLYPAVYFFVDPKFGLLASKTEQLLASMLWNTGFYIHIVCGGIALLTGWIQFSSKIRNRNKALHRQVGKVYVFAVWLSAAAGISIAFFATGGILASSGFICLGLVWFYTTLTGYIKIRKAQIEQHRTMMIYSYAACFAAVTLRIWLPLLILWSGNFIVAYRLVAWLCWIPNMMIARAICSKDVWSGVKALRR